MTCIVLVRMSDTTIVTIKDEDGEPHEYDSEEAAEKGMAEHILKDFPYQIVEIDI